MKGLTAWQARRAVEEKGETKFEVKLQIERFDLALQDAIINGKNSFEVQFNEELYEETIAIIVSRGFKIWKVYQSSDESVYEVPLLLNCPQKTKNAVCKSYKFYF